MSPRTVHFKAKLWIKSSGNKLLQFHPSGLEYQWWEFLTTWMLHEIILNSISILHISGWPEGRLQLKVAFLQWSSSIKGCLPTKVVYNNLECSHTAYYSPNLSMLTITERQAGRQAKKNYRGTSLCSVQKGCNKQSFIFTL